MFKAASLYGGFSIKSQWANAYIGDKGTPDANGCHWRQHHSNQWRIIFAEVIEIAITTFKNFHLSPMVIFLLIDTPWP